ncbi:hypothetical protein Ancab_005360 [Ancistrocladus abbreviatus]
MLNRPNILCDQQWGQRGMRGQGQFLLVKTGSTASVLRTLNGFLEIRVFGDCRKAPGTLAFCRSLCCFFIGWLLEPVGKLGFGSVFGFLCNRWLISGRGNA